MVVKHAYKCNESNRRDPKNDARWAPHGSETRHTPFRTDVRPLLSSSYRLNYEKICLTETCELGGLGLLLAIKLCS